MSHRPASSWSSCWVLRYSVQPASQGIDGTATLLHESSADYQLMTALGRRDPSFLKVPVVPYMEGIVLPCDIPVVQCANSDDSAGLPPAASSSTENDDSQPLTDSAPRLKPKEGTFVFQYVLDYFEMSLEENWPRYRITIGDDEFLVGQPIFETTGLTGRGTRGYVAWHKKSESFVFLKDAWRPFYERVDTEGDILQELNGAGVENIPTLLCHEQLGDHITVVSEYARYDPRTNEERKSASKGPSERTASKGKKRAAEQVDDDVRAAYIRHLIHYRIATKEVCLPLISFRSSEQLVRVIMDCVQGTFMLPPSAAFFSANSDTFPQAHASAVTICKIMHRDISSGNILIIPRFIQGPEDDYPRLQWRGMLCDWELSKPIASSVKDERARQPERTVRPHPPISTTFY